jgi:hypothetical protein
MRRMRRIWGGGYPTEIQKRRTSQNFRRTPFLSFAAFIPCRARGFAFALSFALSFAPLLSFATHPPLLRLLQQLQHLGAPPAESAACCSSGSSQQHPQGRKETVAIRGGPSQRLLHHHGPGPARQHGSSASPGMRGSGASWGLPGQRGSTGQRGSQAAGQQRLPGGSHTHQLEGLDGAVPARTQPGFAPALLI